MVQGADGRLQVPANHRVRPQPADDSDRQDPETGAFLDPCGLLTWSVLGRECGLILSHRWRRQWDCAGKEEFFMPMFMDVHHVDGGVSAADVAGAHAKDIETQEQYGVNYKHYWVSEDQGKIFCLVEAPDADTAVKVHREAHGLVADEIYPVSQGA